MSLMRLCPVPVGYIINAVHGQLIRCLKWTLSMHIWYKFSVKRSINRYYNYSSVCKCHSKRKWLSWIIWINGEFIGVLLLTSIDTCTYFYRIFIESLFCTHQKCFVWCSIFKYEKSCSLSIILWIHDTKIIFKDKRHVKCLVKIMR